MKRVFYQIRTKFEPKAGGSGEIMLPEVLRPLDHGLVAVKDGGEEAVVSVAAPDDVLKKLEKNTAFKPLTRQQMDAQVKSYAPKLKKKFREARRDAGHGEPAPVDDKGERIVDTFQTVRVGFHLVDVPLA